MPTQLLYTGIRVRDLEASVRFYTEVLGMKERGRNSIDATKGTVVDLISPDGTYPLELNFYEPGSRFATPYAPGDGLDHLGFHVDDLDRTIAAARSAGHPLVEEVRTGTTRWVFIQDPNGIWIELSA